MRALSEGFWTWSDPLTEVCVVAILLAAFAVKAKPPQKDTTLESIALELVGSVADLTYDVKRKMKAASSVTMRAGAWRGLLAAPSG